MEASEASSGAAPRVTTPMHQRLHAPPAALLVNAMRGASHADGNVRVCAACARCAARWLAGQCCLAAARLPRAARPRRACSRLPLPLCRACRCWRRWPPPPGWQPRWSMAGRSCWCTMETSPVSWGSTRVAWGVLVWRPVYCLPASQPACPLACSHTQPAALRGGRTLPGHFTCCLPAAVALPCCICVVPPTLPACCPCRCAGLLQPVGPVRGTPAPSWACLK